MIRALFALGLMTAVCSGQIVLKNHSTGAQISSPYVMPDAPVNDTETVALDVVNSGGKAVTITSAGVVGQYFSLCCDTGFVLEPAGSKTLTLTFSPSSAGYFSGTIQIDALTVFLFARADPAASVFVRTTAGEVALRDGAPTVVALDASFSGQLTGVLRNNTGGPVTVTSLSASGDWSLAESVALPLTLQPAQQQEFKLSSAHGAAPSVTSGVIHVDQWSYALTAHPPEPNLAIQVTPSTLSSAEQATLSLNFDAAPTTSKSGQLTISLEPDSQIDVPDPAVVFTSTSSNTVDFNSVPGQVEASFSGSDAVTFQTGTTAGTLHIHAEWDFVTADSSFHIGAAPIGVDSVGASRSGNTLSVTVTGFDNTRTAGRMTFSFFDGHGAFLGNPIPADFTQAFYQYFFESAQSDGGMFKMTAQFPVTSGSASQIDSVQVDLENSAGDTQTSVVRF